MILLLSFYNNVKSISPLIPIISASSIMVIVLMGKLKTSPRQAHFIFCLFSTLCNTPIILIVITAKVTAFVSNGLKAVRKAKPKANSINAYTKHVYFD